jgi:ribose/xylose/arabinose/galactoside ABC-type transport system permease subunit
MSPVLEQPVVAVSRPPTRMWLRILLRPEAAAVFFILVLIVVFGAAANGFFTLGNAQNIVDQVAIVGIIALGMNEVILAGEIDISVGSGVALTSAVAAKTAADHHTGLLLTTLVAVGAGTAIGMVNGFLVTKARIPSIIVTLASLNALRGATNLYNPTGVPSVPENVRAFGRGSVLGLNSAIIVLLAAFVIMGVVTRHTTWGRELPAIGGNERAARLAGLPPDRFRWVAFAVLGACVGIASMVTIGEVGSVQPTAATGLELQVIAAVVIGGTSISGGRGLITAAVAGALLLGTLLNGSNLLGLQERWQSLFIGAVILIAIGSDVVRRRMLERLVTS